MAKLPSKRKLLREDLKEAPAWVDKILGFVNPFFEDVYYSLNKNITLRENIDCDIKEITIETSSTYTNNIPDLGPIQNEVNSLDSRVDDLENAPTPSSLPIGSIIMWTSKTELPIGYLKCEGQLVSKTTYSELFSLLGTTYGNSTINDFKLPDYKGLVPRGIGTKTISILFGGTRYKVGGDLGEFVEDQLQDHVHYSLAASNRNGNPDGGGDSGGGRKYWRYAETQVSTTSVDDGARHGAETQASSLGTLFIIKALNLEIASATSSAINSLNSRVGDVEIKQDNEKLIQIVAVNRTFKTTTGNGTIVADDSSLAIVSAWNKRKTFFMSQTPNSTDYFEQSNEDIIIKKAGQYKIDFEAQFRRGNFGQVMAEYKPISGDSIFKQITTQTTTTTTNAGSEQNICSSMILDVPLARVGGTLNLSQWTETNTSNEHWGLWYCRGSDGAPYNYIDTCTISATLIKDL